MAKIVQILNSYETKRCFAPTLPFHSEGHLLVPPPLFSHFLEEHDLLLHRAKHTHKIQFSTISQVRNYCPVKFDD